MNSGQTESFSSKKGKLLSLMFDVSAYALHMHRSLLQAVIMEVASKLPIERAERIAKARREDMIWALFWRAANCR